MTTVNLTREKQIDSARPTGALSHVPWRCGIPDLPHLYAHLLGRDGEDPGQECLVLKGRHESWRQGLEYGELCRQDSELSRENLESQRLGNVGPLAGGLERQECQSSTGKQVNQ